MSRRHFATLLCAALAGCAGLPPSAPGPEPVKSQSPLPAGEMAAQRAATLVGTPYRLGGASPIEGFDCSGLVHFTFREAGMYVPRTTDALRHAARPVKAAELRAGDLLFFNLEGKRNSHVGIYVGDGTFVHAPSTGKDVRRDSLSSPFWRKQLSELRRL